MGAVTTFQRARSPEQRDARRTAILSTAAELLSELPVAQLSLNELARRVGLAKSNVLRYFESREAVLLELLDAQQADWLAALDREPAPDGDTAARIEALATRVATSLAARPVLCDLVGAQAGVLEHNVSIEVAARHKRASIEHTRSLAGLVARTVPELGPAAAFELAGVAMLAAGALWAHSCPSAAMLAVYEAEPELAAFRLGFTEVLSEVLAVFASGLVARGPGLPAAP
jgi:AcrR family transcriptional regulator